MHTLSYKRTAKSTALEYSCSFRGTLRFYKSVTILILVAGLNSCSNGQQYEIAPQIGEQVDSVFSMDFGNRLVENELKNRHPYYRSEVVGVAVSSQMWIDDSLYSRPLPTAVQMGASYSGDTLVLIQSFASGGGSAAVTFRFIGRRIIATLDVLQQSSKTYPRHPIEKVPLVFEKAVLNKVSTRDDTSRLKGHLKFRSEDMVIDAEHSATQKEFKLRIAMDVYFTQVHPDISDYGEGHFR